MKLTKSEVKALNELMDLIKEPYNKLVEIETGCYQVKRQGGAL